MRWIPAVGIMLWTSVAWAQSPPANNANPSPPAEKQKLEFRFPVDGGVHEGLVEEVTPEGLVRISRSSREAGGRPELVEGLYLGLLPPDPPARSLEGARLLQVQVTEVLENGARLQVGKAAVGLLKARTTLVIFRPAGATTAELKAAPELAQIESAEDEALGLVRGSAEDLTTSQNNLKMIGLAMHNFHDVYGAFPPAVIHGPDGKPWHSWRVLLLPFLEQQALYEQYRFDEPWNGPNNSKLLEKIPSVYRDPVHGEPMDYYTHYAASTGKGVAFPAEGISFDGDPGHLYSSDKKGNVGRTRLAHFTDGASNSLLAGAVSPSRKIPWLKPEDVVVDEATPPPGKDDKKGFAAPYVSRKGAAGMFLFADGSVQTFTDACPPDSFRTLLTIADGIPVDRFALPSLDGGSGGGPKTPVLTIETTAKGPVAKLRMEPIPAAIPPARFPAPARRAAPPR